MILRDYQKEAVLNTLNKKENTVIVAPTGSGKSIIIVELIKKMKAKKTLIFQPTANILKQNLSHYKNSTGKEASIMSAGGGGHKVGKVTFSTIGTAINNVESLKDTDLILIDECHNVDPIKAKTMYRQFFKKINYDGPIFGLTATPSRNYRKFDTKSMMMVPAIDVLTNIGGKDKFWKSFSYIVDINHLIKNNYLLKPIYKLEEDIDLSNLKLTSDGSNFTKESIKLFDEKNMLKVFNVCKKAYEERNSIVCFVDTIEVAKKLSSLLNEANIVSDYMSSERTSKENEACLEKFKNEPKMILTNCNMVSEGIDVRKCDGIILATPTSSLNRYIQRVGRALRIPEEGKSKLTPIIYDIAQSSERFAPVEDIIWTENKIRVKNSNKILSGFQEGFNFLENYQIKEKNYQSYQTQNKNNKVSKINKSNKKFQFQQRNLFDLVDDFVSCDIFGEVVDISDELMSKKGNKYKKIEIDTLYDKEESKIITLMIMEKNWKHFDVKEGDLIKCKCGLKGGLDSDFGFGYFTYNNPINKSNSVSLLNTKFSLNTDIRNSFNYYKKKNSKKNKAKPKKYFKLRNNSPLDGKPKTIRRRYK